MATYERSVRVDAPFEEVWTFHASTSGLEALTPSWMHLEVEAITGPDGSPDPDELETGSTILASVQPFGLGPRQGWTSEIVARDRDGSSGFFRDEMVDGPFREWEHTHLFYGDGNSTVVRDRIRYTLPYGGVGEAFGPLAKVGFEPMFRYRHRRTKELLER